MTEMTTCPPPAVRSSSGASCAIDALIAAHRHITSDLSLATMPQRIVAAAGELAGGGRAGFILLNSDGAVVEFAQHGLDEWSASSLSDLARPAHDIGGSARDREARMACAGWDCLVVRVRGERWGELYVPEQACVPEQAGRADAQAAGTRSALHALAAIAGTALENAVLYEEAARSRDWLQASGEIARALLADGDVDTLLDVVRRAMHVAEADYAGLLLPRSDGLMEVSVTAGLGEQEYRGLTLDPESALGRTVRSGRSLLVSDVAEIAGTGFENPHAFGPIMAAPLVDVRGVRGSVVLCRLAGRRPFSARDLDLATTFADQIALALELDDARGRGERLIVVEDRHRIAQDLHDSVMQRLFATGVGLHSLASAPLPSGVADRLSRYVAELDETIDTIRNRVFGLHGPDDRPRIRAENRFPRVVRSEAPTAAL